MTPSTFRSSFIALCLAWLVGGALAQSCDAQPQPQPSDPRAEIERLYRNGDGAQALQRLSEAMAAQPGNPQLRFLQGVLLADSGPRAQAEQVYERLTQDYPELPEPYNNLAALYASEGRLDEARNALETALRNAPGYATAEENLGDVYVRLAQRAYQQAGSGRPELERKLQLVRALAAVPPAAGNGQAPRNGS
jgi:Flp pilus assembly protein TadD